MLYDQLKKQKLLVLNDPVQMRNLLLVSSLSVFIYWGFIFYLDKLSWYFNIGLALGLITFFSWLVTNYSKKAYDYIIPVHYCLNLLFNLYMYLLLWQTNMHPTYLVLSVVVISISGSTFSHFKWLCCFYILSFITASFLPQTNPVETKWFFAFSILIIGVITGLQFTKRLKSLELMSTTYKRFNEISEGNYGGILIFKDNSILEVNATLKHIFGLEQGIETSRISVSDLIGTEAFREIREILSSNPSPLEYSGELSVQGKLRPTFYVEYSLRNIEMLEGPAVAMFFKDVSDLKHSQTIISEQASTLKKVSRLSDLGELSAGIAHEINNPLAIISGMADEILYVLECNGEMDKKQLMFLSNKIIQNTERINKIIKGLKTFVRDGSEDPFKDFAVESILKESVEICETALAKQGIELKLKGIKQDSLTMARGRSIQIEQVLVNLINNAKDAILDQDQPWIEVSLEPESDLINIKITDSGYGIPIKEQSKIFDSYYTTKSAGQGTGLGLSIAKQILDEHNGSLEIDSNSPNTCFVIKLPILATKDNKVLNFKA